jgi:adenylosuccinate synthase
MASSGEYDCVVRFNGGGNAGHTIYLNGEKIVTHLVPCGVLHGITSVIGNGCVINTKKLFEELEYLEGFGFDTSVLKIAENAHIITQEHIDEDSKDTKIGTKWPLLQRQSGSNWYSCQRCSRTSTISYRYA